LPALLGAQDQDPDALFEEAVRLHQVGDNLAADRDEEARPVLESGLTVLRGVARRGGGNSSERSLEYTRMRAAGAR
jgi:hypothetical protein